MINKFTVANIHTNSYKNKIRQQVHKIETTPICALSRTNLSSKGITWLITALSHCDLISYVNTVLLGIPL